VRALVKTRNGVGHVELTEVPVPEPAKGEVLIRVRAAGVCATDVHIARGRFPCTPPVTLGHEFSGVVERVGEDVGGVRAGDRVVSENNPMACGTCRVCSQGFPNLCAQKRAMGFHSDGCFAEYVKLPAHLLHVIPPGVTFEAAALAEPLAVAVHAAADRCGIEKGDTVVVTGPGTIGLLAGQVARAEGADRVVAAGTDRDVAVRLPCAAGLGLDPCNVDREDLGARIASLTGGTGADVVIEASGATPAVVTGLGLLRRGGRMAVSGITGGGELPLDWDGLVARALTLCFCYSSRRRNWDRGLAYLADGRVQTLPLVTHRMTLDQWPEAFDALERRESIRTVFDMAG
jgi:L-iditol 2-dehydrogenase